MQKLYQNDYLSSRDNRANQLYRFIVGPNCKRCQEMAKNAATPDGTHHPHADDLCATCSHPAHHHVPVCYAKGCRCERFEAIK